ncbi:MULTISPECIES: hypothetical protein [Thalassospira]|nr:MULTISPECIES: hypothetical protein [Thalassospira]
MPNSPIGLVWLPMRLHMLALPTDGDGAPLNAPAPLSPNAAA